MNEIKSDIPIIKTFIYEGKYYFYDTYTNRLFRISKEQFAELSELQKIGVSAYKCLNKKTQSYEDILMLIQKGMLKTSIVNKIMHPATSFIDSIIDRCINDITLQVTRNCNFRCRYCLFANSNGIERKHESVNMSWDIAKKSVDFLYDHSKDANILTIAFYGGEPMLNFELIKDVVEYATNRFFSKKVIYRMTINGSVLTDEMIDYIVKRDFYIVISFDGPKEIQNKHRKFFDTGEGTFDIVRKNISRIKELHPNYFQKNVSFIPVVFDDEDDREIFEFFDDNEITEEKILMLDADLTGLDYYIKNSANYAEKRMKYSKDEQSYNNKSPIPAIWHHNGPCIPSIKSLFVDVNGIFYPCEGVIALNELSIGDIETGLNSEKIVSYMNIGKLSEQRCKSCWLMRFCSICILNCIDVDKKTLTKKQKYLACSGQEYRVISFLKKHIKESQ